MRIPRAALPVLLSLLAAGILTAQSLAVVSVAPAGNSLGASPAAAITVAFDAPPDPATVNPATFRVFGRWSGAVPGALAVAGSTVTFTPGRTFFAAELVTLMVSAGVATAGGAPLTGGFTSWFFVGPIAGSASFTLDHVVDFRLPGEGLIRTYGFNAADVDRDGSPDMSATNEVASDVRVLRNSGCGQFTGMTIHPLAAGQEPSPNEGADLNGDGWTDLVTGNQNGNAVAVFLNDGSGSFLAPVTYPMPGSCHGVAVLDADADGDVDVVATDLSNVLIFLNDGTGTLVPGGSVSGGGSGEYQVVAADADHDGRADLFVGNRFSGTVGLLLGDGLGGFTFSAAQATGGAPWGLAAGDVNGDGHVDVLVTNNNQSTVAVVRGDGAGGLLPAVGYGTSSNPISADVADLDGDQDLDLTVGNFNAADCNVFFNDGTGAFVQTFAPLLTQIATSCSVLLDFDRDGDTDIVVTDELADKAFVYRQVGPAPAGVQAPGCDAALRLQGYASRAGFGALSPRPLSGGSTLFVGVSGAAGQPFALAAGNAAVPGLALAPGILNLALDPALVIVIDGFAAGPPGVTDAAGEATLAFPLPASVPVGLAFTLQALVQTQAGLALSNPESGQFAP